ncbi:MAG: aldo/keto reductase [Parvularculaceae bacterium]
MTPVTEIRRTRLGFGVSGPHAERWFSAEKLTALVRQAYEGGICDFDCAPFYGDGLAEERLGAALNSIDAGDARISSKTGTRRSGRRVEKNFSEKAIREDLAATLGRLRRDRVDILYLHGPTRAQVRECAPLLRQLRTEGLIDAFGICGEGAPLDVANVEDYGALMGAFNFADRRHDDAFARARRRGVTTTAIAPLAQAVYDRDFYRLATPSGMWKALRRLAKGDASSQQRALRMREVLEQIRDRTPAQAALGFVLGSENVSVAMTTTSSHAHLADLLAVQDQPLPAADFERLRRAHLDRDSARA